jgi:uncharacterized protein (DUF2249 family)
MTTATLQSTPSSATRTISHNVTQSAPTYGFDARGVAKRFRHAAIFGALESLNEGETMRFVNDHDPLPLLQQIAARYGNQVGVAYVAREPGNIVIDFTVQDPEPSEATAAALASAMSSGGGCGGGGCGCSGAR